MKKVKLALAILPMAMASLASCSTGQWKSDASQIAVTCANRSAVYGESDERTPDSYGKIRVVTLSYIEEGSAITVREAAVWLERADAKSEYAEISRETETTRYANAQWTITYKENL